MEGGPLAEKKESIGLTEESENASRRGWRASVVSKHEQKSQTEEG